MNRLQQIWKYVCAIACFVVVASVGSNTLCAPAHALDKRVKMVFKTSAYGAGVGLLAGGAFWAMGIGGLDNFRNLMIGTSLGLYAGLALGLYVVAIPPEPRGAVKPANPNAPRQPVGPNDWMEEDEDIEEYKRSQVPAATSYWADSRNPMRPIGPLRAALWIPLAQVAF